MSCYMRHLEELFKIAGIEASKENKKAFDLLLKKKFKTATCPQVWARVKEYLGGPKKRNKLLAELKKI
ncbi:MAG: hypothetical protein A2252_09810 [Elusimicrobia bacterium RIFOXYA2_FULL_39_19]|nr:MAG: hypothetical protein A2252_09810 [Elusimicrobia bacterium RIFOXYA2_FULL_39_19]